MGFYSVVGGYNLVSRVSCLSDIWLHHRPISEKARNPATEVEGYIYIYIYTYIQIQIHMYKNINPNTDKYISLLFLLPLDVDLVFLDNKKWILNSMGLYVGRGAYKCVFGVLQYVI